MEENRIYISEEKTEYRMLPMNGTDSQGNFYEADALSLRKNGKRFLPVMGGYVDAPWAEHTDQMPASENFIFSNFKQDRNIGSDRKVTQEDGFTFDPSQNPYLTAELGGGLQVTAHRRTWPSPEDIEAQSVCMLGSGANLLGYYMYHGGINPDGKYSTLQESRATGYANDLPVKSYDSRPVSGNPARSAQASDG